MKRQKWRNKRTGQVVATEIVRPALYNFLTTQCTEEMMNHSGWVKCADCISLGMPSGDEAKTGNFNDDDFFAH
jgi:hypothetical protein